MYWILHLFPVCVWNRNIARVASFIFGQIWKVGHKYQKKRCLRPTLATEHENQREVGALGAWMYQKSLSLHNMRIGISLKTLKDLTNSFWILYSAQTASLSEGHPMIFSLSSVIIPFPLHERKDRNNPAEIYGSPGAKLLCRNKWKTRAAEAEWDAARSRVSRPHGAQPIDTDSAHYMSRLYGDQLKSVVWATQHVWFMEEIVGLSLVWNWMVAEHTVMKYSVSTCNRVCGELRKERLWSQLALNPIWPSQPHIWCHFCLFPHS